MFFKDFFRNEKINLHYQTKPGNKASWLILSVYFIEKYGLYICIATVYKGVVIGVLFRKCMPTTVYVFNGLEKSTNIQMKKSVKCEQYTWL